MEPAATALDRELRHDGKTIRGAARQAARQARVAANHEARKLIADVEELLRRVSDAADPELARLRAKLESTVATTKKAISDGTEQVQRQAKEVFEASDRYVRDQPWEAIGIAAIAGLAIGLLVGRR